MENSLVANKKSIKVLFDLLFLKVLYLLFHMFHLQVAQMYRSQKSTSNAAKEDEE